MFDPLVPYNELPHITTLYVDTASGLARLAEDTRVAIEILRYAVASSICKFCKGLEGLKKHSRGIKEPGTMQKAENGTRKARERLHRPGRVGAVQISFQTSDIKPTLKA